MNKRKKDTEYVKHGGAKPLCSPQIGCGAGYVSNICGLEWVSQTKDVPEEYVYALCDEAAK